MNPATCNVTNRQRGVALVIILLLLLVMTLLGLASLRGTLMEERMSAGSYDRSLSFQGAEAALREAEASIAAGTRCGGGACPRPLSGGTDIWVSDPECDDAGIWTTAVTVLGGPVEQPVYAIELMGPAPPPTTRAAAWTATPAAWSTTSASPPAVATPAPAGR